MASGERGGVPAGSPPTRVARTFVKTVQSAKYEHLVAGISGGVASTLVLHPLDLLKIRFAGEVRQRMILFMLLPSLTYLAC